jgi:16S rRNA (cytosine1402-N4)-methyltransferase
MVRRLDAEQSDGMHESVLIREVTEYLAIREGGFYIDGTVGSGGHAGAILERTGADSFLIGIDRDKEALERARERLGKWGKCVRLVHGNFADVGSIAGSDAAGSVDGILFDLGISSEQIADSRRGFSFVTDGPLDMRMNGGEEKSAKDIVNTASEEELQEILWRFGEERGARRVARMIVRERSREPILTTGKLADIVARALGRRNDRIHPATRTFQALRICVNDELGSLERGLDAAAGLLAANGRLAVISFHSLEDRIVKRFFASHAGKWESLQAGGRRLVVAEPAMKVLTRKPVVASETERLVNTRSRSAKLRVAERASV